LSSYDNYFKINYNGKIGYIHEMYVNENYYTRKLKNNAISKSKTTTTARDPIGNVIEDYSSKTTIKHKAKLRTEADPFGTVIYSIPVNSSVYLLEYKNNYFKISYNEKVGYIHQMYVNENYYTQKLKN
jgi:hypothetical protein